MICILIIAEFRLCVRFILG